MKHIYHSHTVYCNHAKMTVEELINKAISEGYETIGISEHIFSEAGELTFALQNEARAKQYVEEVNHFKKVYKDKIRVLCGFEMEMNDSLSNKCPYELNNRVLSWDGVDYGLWAFHYYAPEMHVFSVKATDEQLKHFLDCVETSFKNGCTYMAHPDGFIEGNGGWDERAQAVSEQIIDLAVKHGVILAMNINGYYHQKKYPSREFWALVAQKGAKMTIELDAHSQNPFRIEYINEVEAIAASIGLKPIEKVW